MLYVIKCHNVTKGCLKTFPVRTEQNQCNHQHHVSTSYLSMALFFLGPDVCSCSLAAVHPSACLINPTTCPNILSPVYCLSQPQGRQAKLTQWAARLSYLKFPLVTRFLIKMKNKHYTHLVFTSYSIIKLNEGHSCVSSPLYSVVAAESGWIIQYIQQKKSACRPHHVCLVIG